MPITPEQLLLYQEVQRAYTAGNSFTAEEEDLLRWLLAEGWMVIPPEPWPSRAS